MTVRYKLSASGNNWWRYQQDRKTPSCLQCDRALPSIAYHCLHCGGGIHSSCAYTHPPNVTCDYCREDVL